LEDDHVEETKRLIELHQSGEFIPNKESLYSKNQSFLNHTQGNTALADDVWKHY
jgi:hypothetical protein